MPTPTGKPPTAMSSHQTIHTRYDAIPAFVTKDGSLIRELLHPDSSAAIRQSLAEAVVETGQTTALHRHRQSEEIYHLTEGEGIMTLGDATFPVRAGDSVLIKPGTAHCIQNTGAVTLRILCACSPAYSHDDTELMSSAGR